MKGFPFYRTPFAILSIAFFLLFLTAGIYMEQYYLAAVPVVFLLFYAGWQDPKYIFFLLLALIPFSIEYQLNPTLATDFPDELLMTIVTLLAVCYVLRRPALMKPILQHPLFFIITVWFCWIIVTVAFSGQQLVSLKYLLAKSWYIGAFVIVPILVLRTKHDLLVAGRILAFAMLIVTIIIFTRHYFYSFRFAEVNLVVVPFFRNHVNYGALLVCSVPLFFAGYKLSRSRNHKFLAGIAIFILLTALYFSFSRGAWLALAAGMLGWIMIKKKILFQAFILSICLLAGLFFWIRSNERYLQFANDFNKTIYHTDIREHLISTYNLTDVSTAERVYRWVAGVRMIRDQPLTGYGPNTFYENYKGYALPAFRTWVSNNEDRSTVHNYYLLLAVEQGIPGLLIFLVLAGMVLYYAQHLYHLIRDPFYKTVILAIASIFSMALFLNFMSDLIETDKIGSIFFLCSGVLIIIGSNARSDIQRIT